jgi:hypothetical protein
VLEVLGTRYLALPAHSNQLKPFVSHNSLEVNEQIVGRAENMSADEINRIDDERKVVKQCLYIANKGPGVHAANTKAYSEKSREEQRYKCTV